MSHKLTLEEIEAYLRESPGNFTYQRLYSEATGGNHAPPQIDMVSLQDVSLARWQEWLEDCKRHISGECSGGPCPQEDYYEKKKLDCEVAIERIEEQPSFHPYLRVINSLESEIEQEKQAIAHREERIRENNHGKGYQFDHMFLRKHQEKLDVLEAQLAERINQHVTSNS